METTKITEGNKLIAEFMNLGNDIEGRISFYYSIGEEFPHTLRICTEELIESEVHSEIEDMVATDFIVETYSFHNSWDWLMPVVKKIENLYDGDVLVEISDEKCYIGYGSFYQNTATAETKIKAVYGAVVEFIKWYNLE